ncbi:unnamed protein product [Trifolium pratense]|uniref:Uncharacterized protein n=1 Tax=Trifolium pratense TaxID=57577 RepID=A0ACB0KDN9_TRIPR|nr:unnamed protein product [Trifolium pratense]
MKWIDPILDFTAFLVLFIFLLPPSSSSSIFSDNGDGDGEGEDHRHHVLQIFCHSFPSSSTFHLLLLLSSPTQLFPPFRLQTIVPSLPPFIAILSYLIQIENRIHFFFYKRKPYSLISDSKPYGENPNFCLPQIS